jgi:hypothetical protein
MRTLWPWRWILWPLACSAWRPGKSCLGQSPFLLVLLFWHRKSTRRNTEQEKSKKNPMLFCYYIDSPLKPSTVNPFLFIRGLCCPSCIQAFLNCLKLTIPEFLHNCFLVSCGDIGFKKNPRPNIAQEIWLQSALLPWGHSCPLQTVLLSDLVGCDSPLQRIMAFWRTIIVNRGLSHPTQKVWIQTQRAPNSHFYLQRAVTPDCMGRIALW